MNIIKNKGNIGTFILNKKQPIHRWYKYDEGYSSEFIYKEIENLPIHPTSLFEPFAGSGTTPLVASSIGVQSFYTEMNPFMRFVTDTKINAVRKSIKKKFEVVDTLNNFSNLIMNSAPSLNQHIMIGGFEKFYKLPVLSELLFIKNKIKNISDVDCQSLANLALAAIVVPVSNMIKRGDLRYAKEGEKNVEHFNVKLQYKHKLEQIIEDLSILELEEYAEAICIGEDARTAIPPMQVDCIITSPPYLNGTNYIRNTKLELNILDFVESESELKILHSNGIIAGINNVSSRREVINSIPELVPILQKLEPVAYDVRIPKMVIGYFNDMSNFFLNASKAVRHKGYLVMDIGDSQFAGIHIPTDSLLTIIAEKYGFNLYDQETLRTRRSKNQMILSQKVLRYQLNKKGG
ncbi:hypothetical protein [Paenibacillus campi]|uniref:hypothetical protein n=1 Tax=Paenibacillus campi TaxID=3106031 RepID=UPI002AFF7E9F|nr:hypothetical protein [Paenibacillus sp. SGZ-1009]